MMDCIIIGAGPAGLSAALEIKRLGLSLAVFESSKPGGQAKAANLIENFLGFPDGISGHELMGRVLRQAESSGITILNERVVNVKKNGSAFSVNTTCGSYNGRSVIVASGLVPKLIGVPGEREFFEKQIFAYPDPLSLQIKDKRVAVVGAGDAAFDMAVSASSLASEVAIFMRGKTPSCTDRLAKRAANAGVIVYDSIQVVSFRKDCQDIVIQVLKNLERGEFIFDVVIVCIGKKTDLHFVDETLLQKNARGIYFAGDCVADRQRHVVIAMGEGLKAALNVAKYLETF